jgi:uncharacterized membrane protein
MSATYGFIARPTYATRIAIGLMALAVVVTATFLILSYPSLPWLLPVHFKINGAPNGWQYRTPTRVMLPVFVQLALLFTFGTIGALLLSRPHGKQDPDAADVKAARAAAEAVILIALVWVAFHTYSAIALTRMWISGRQGLGVLYTYFELTGLVLTSVVFMRANALVGRPAPRPYVAEHWRHGQLYKNPEDPALFVPTRDGSRWTLNFGRPVAAALLGLILVIGIVAPTVILGLTLRS